MPETPSRPATAEQPAKHRPPLNGTADAFRTLLRPGTENGAYPARMSSERPAASRPASRPASRSATWEVPVSDQAPGQVRRWAAGLLTRWGAADLIEDATTVLTELVTNACQAKATRMAVLIEPDAGPDIIEVCVWDNAPGTPQQREPDFYAERGRGLFLVDALTTRWGHHPLTLDPGHPGKVVWAHLAGSGDGA